MNNNLPKGSDPLELIAPLPIEWEISSGLDNVPVECSPTGTITCSMGKG